MPTEAHAAGSFVLLHGYQHHRPKGHWLHWLADELRARGHRVAYPQLPRPEHPDRAEWIDTLHEVLAGAGARPTVIGHSLGSWLWLNAVSGVDRPVARVLLVAPPAPDTIRLIRDLNGFDLPFGPELAAALARHPTRFLGGDDDPWCDGGVPEHFGRPLDLPTWTVPGGAHLDLQAGYGAWPSMLTWCLTGAGPIVARPAPR